MSSNLVTATLRKCGSKWCLYTRDGSRLLGKHDSKEKAMAQERAIKAHGAVVALLDDIAQELEARGATALAEAVDSDANRMLEQNDDMLERTGFENMMRRDSDVADTLFETHIDQIDPGQSFRGY